MFWQNTFKVVCCRIVVWGKGLTQTGTIIGTVWTPHYYRIYTYKGQFTISFYVYFHHAIEFWNFKHNCTFWPADCFANLTDWKKYLNWNNIQGNKFRVFLLKLDQHIINLQQTTFKISSRRLGKYLKSRKNRFENIMAKVGISLCLFCLNVCYSFPTCRRILTHLQQTTFENIVAKGEIDHDEQFPIFPQCFQLNLMFKLSFIEIFVIFVNMF